MAVSVNDFASNLDGLTEQSFNDAFEAYIQVIHKVIDKHAPLKQMSRKQKKIKSKPWVTKSIYESIRLKNIMYKTHYLSNDDARKREYKIFANKLTKTKALAKKRFYGEEFENNKNNSRKTWELLRTLFPGKSSKDSSLPQNITVQGNKITRYRNFCLP